MLIESSFSPLLSYVLKIFAGLVREPTEEASMLTRVSSKDGCIYEEFIFILWYTDTEKKGYL